MTTTKGLRMITEETVASNEWLYDEMICLTSAQQEYKETHTTLLFHEWLLQSIEQYPSDIRGLVCTNDTTLTVLSTLLQSSKMRNLETVFFSLGRLIDDNPDFIDQLPILSSFTHLKTLKINKTTNLNIPLLNKMLPYLNKLEDLNLFDNNIDSQDLVSIIETIGKTNCPDLKSFTIIGNELGKEGVIALVENFADRNLLLRLPPIALENLKLLNECKDGITTLIMYNIPSVEDIQNALPSHHQHPWF
ncbi:hypothetical protein [Candidatus Tisiphia endosymbiont of Nemotelus uliginosus]|uniref:hypothetical protein n=1 Tax=Candidatus Tisiphia endosymbiont of Nemotelus uliginosus TaxID=3077926 RepID=UPI0035C8AA06